MSEKVGRRFSVQEVEVLDRRFAPASPQDVLEWALGVFDRRIALAWSGAEDVAVLHMMTRIHPRPRVFTLDTGRLNPETYDFLEEVHAKYGLEIEVLFPEAEPVERMVRERGVNLFYRSIEDRRLCCRIRKVEPLNRILAALDGWVTGLRRAQSAGRQATRKIELDVAHGGILKVNPIANWTTSQVFEYLERNGVPRNKLHDLGYVSIGCAPCTRAVRPGEDERAGRWWWENAEGKECGLHVPYARSAAHGSPGRMNGSTAPKSSGQ